MALDYAFEKLHQSYSVVIQRSYSNAKLVLKQFIEMSVLSAFAKCESVIFVNDPFESNINNVLGTQSLPRLLTTVEKKI